MRRLLNWFFVDRRTSAVTIAQWPNLLLWIAIGAGIAVRISPPPGNPGFVLTIVLKGALVLWALDEIFRGVNPWRRCRAAVLAFELSTFV
jgi:hypothetical protein